MLSEKKQWQNLATANAKKVKCVKHENLEEAYVIGGRKKRQRERERTAKNEVTEEEAKMICKYCILCIKCSSNMLLFHNEDAFITLIMLWV